MTVTVECCRSFSIPGGLLPDHRPILLGSFGSIFLDRRQWYLQFKVETIRLEVEENSTIELLFGGLLDEPGPEATLLGHGHRWAIPLDPTEVQRPLVGADRPLDA